MGLGESKNLTSDSILNNDINNDINNDKKDYFECLPGDIQKLIYEYMTTFESIETMIQIYPNYKHKILDSVIQFEKSIDERKIFGINVSGPTSIDSDYITKFKNIKKINCQITVNSIKDIHNLINIPHFYRYDIVLYPCKGDELIISMFEICKSYLSANKNIYFNKKTECSSSIKIYNNKYEPIFIYDNGILTIIDEYISEIRTVWNILNNYGCVLRGAVFTKISKFSNSENFIRPYFVNFIQENICKKYIDENGNEQFYFNYLGIDYLSCCNTSQGNPLFLCMILAKMNPNINNIEFLSDGYDTSYYLGRSGYNFTFITSLKASGINNSIFQKVNIYFNNIISIGQSPDFSSELLNALSVVFKNINNLHFTPIIYDNSSANETFNGLEKLAVDPFFLSLSSSGVKFYFNNNIYNKYIHDITKDPKKYQTFTSVYSNYNNKTNNINNKNINNKIKNITIPITYSQ